MKIRALKSQKSKKHKERFLHFPKSFLKLDDKCYSLKQVYKKPYSTCKAVSNSHLACR